MGFSRVEVNKTRCLASRFGVRDLGMAFQYIRPSVSRAIKREERELSDERILGSGDFVTTVLGKSYQADLRKCEKMSLELLGRKIASYFKIKEEDLMSTVKRKSVTEAKSAFGYLAIKKMGYSGREIGRFLNMRSYSAIRRAQEGKKVIDKSEFLRDLAEK